jgi:hypothetical protein
MMYIRDKAMDTPRKQKMTEAPDKPGIEQITSTTSVKRMPPRVYRALILLLESDAYAKDLSESPWEFAVEFHSLRELGLTKSDFRWLVGKRVVDHAREATLPGEQRRSFRRCDQLVLSHKTCFVLSEQGIAFASQIVAREQPPSMPANAFTQSREQIHYGSSNGKLVPKWDRDRQELRVGDQIVKQFKVPAANQETILAVFEEERWPPRIDDPLPPQPEQDSKRRLHDTINSLNRNQKQPLLRFLGDGSGKGVRWELATNPSRRDNC